MRNSLDVLAQLPISSRGQLPHFKVLKNGTPAVHPTQPMRRPVQGVGVVAVTALANKHPVHEDPGNGICRPWLPRLEENLETVTDDPKLDHTMIKYIY